VSHSALTLIAASLYCCCQAYSKSGLISTREDKHSGDTILTAVNRSHALLSDYRPYKTAAASSSSNANGSSSATGQGSSVAASGEGGSIAPLVVEEVFKPSRDVKGESAMVRHVHTQQVCWQYR
jgi:translation initiation factor 2D